MKSTREWRIRAEQDALWAVAAHPGKKGTWDLDDFYELGRSDWADFRKHWQQYLAGDLSGACVEIGSGAGRITAQLVKDFDQVFGLDVSNHMIQLAKQVAPTAVFHQVDDTRMPFENSTVNAVFSCHVLQHFETEEDVRSSLREAFRVLQPGGTLMVHLILRGRVNLVRSLIGDIRRAVGPRMRRGRGVTIARKYSAAVVRDMVESAGFTNVELREFPTTSNKAPHAFWFGTK